MWQVSFRPSTTDRHTRTERRKRELIVSLCTYTITHPTCATRHLGGNRKRSYKQCGQKCGKRTTSRMQSPVSSAYISMHCRAPSQDCSPYSSTQTYLDRWIHKRRYRSAWADPFLWWKCLPPPHPATRIFEEVEISPWYPTWVASALESRLNGRRQGYFPATYSGVFV